MTPEMVVGLASQAIQVTLIVSLPLLLIGLVVGVVVSLLQAATQIQEMTLTFVPKIVSILIGLFLLLPWIMNRLIAFTVEVFRQIPTLTH
jgi:flagellar biosynthetic protein FliQ